MMTEEGAVVEKGIDEEPKTTWLNFLWQWSIWTGASLIREIVTELDKRKLAESFHFFYEEREVELRIEVEEGRAEEIVKAVDNCVRKMGGNAPQQGTYEGEKKLYGERGWRIVRKFFEYSSRIALEKDQPDKYRDEQRGFADHKLVHCYLNQQGMSILDEVAFHQTRYWFWFDKARTLIPPPPRQ